MSTAKLRCHFYVYEWFRPDTGDCFYSGKGSGRRAWSYHSRNYVFRRVIAELREMNLKPIVRIFKDNLTNREALKLERRRMAYWAGRFVKLANSTGTYRRKFSTRRVRKGPSPETLARVRRMFG